MCACVAWMLVSRFPCGGFKVLVWSCSVPPEPPFPGPPFPGPPFPGPPFPRPPFPGPPFPRPPFPGPPKISRFFPSPATIFFLSSLSGVFSLNFGGVSKTGTLKCARLGYWAVVFNPSGFGAAGASHDSPENSKRAHLSAPALQTPPKFHEKTPREGRKERILRREREKDAKFWAPHPSGPHPSGPPPFRAPPSHPSGPHPSATLRPPFSTHPRQLKTHKKT